VIAERVGNPDSAPPWQWARGFYPCSDPSEHARGLAESFDQARVAFEVAWRIFLAKRTEVDFADYRRDRAFHAWKQAMWTAGLQLLTQVADGRAVCFCGAAIGIDDINAHVWAAQWSPRRHEIR
jgi:hypothetical protein